MPEANMAMLKGCLVASALLLLSPNAFSERDNGILEVGGVREQDIRKVDLQKFVASKPYREYQVVTIDSSRLLSFIRSTADQDSIELTLLGAHVALLPKSGLAEEHVEGPYKGFAFWKGQIEGADWSDVLIRISPNGGVQASFQSPELGLIYLEQIGEGAAHLVWSVDDEKISSRRNGEYE